MGDLNQGPRPSEFKPIKRIKSVEFKQEPKTLEGLKLQRAIQIINDNRKQQGLAPITQEDL